MSNLFNRWTPTVLEWFSFFVDRKISFFEAIFFSKSGLSLQGGFPTDKYGHFLRSCHHHYVQFSTLVRQKFLKFEKKNGMIKNVIIHQSKFYSCSFLTKFIWNWLINKLIIRDCQWPEYRLFLFLRIKPYLLVFILRLKSIYHSLC